ncbi:MAG: ferritin-like domain-containing protein [Polyangiaceae bacterium]
MAASPPPSDAVRDEWLRRVQAEYTSAAITQHLGLWLIQIGASPDLIKASLRIVTDEVEHARLSHVAYVRAGGAASPGLAQERLSLRRTPGSTLEGDVARVALQAFCLGETVAVPLFKRLRDGCTVPVARRVLDRVLRDEVRHRDFGWLLLDWLLQQPYAPAVRTVAEAELPGMFRRLADMYGYFEAPTGDHLSPPERAWGLMKVTEYGAIVKRTFARDWRPRFTKRGIDADAAWGKGLSAAPVSA